MLFRTPWARESGSTRQNVHDVKNSDCQWLLISASNWHRSTDRWKTQITTPQWPTAHTLRSDAHTMDFPTSPKRIQNWLKSQAQRTCHRTYRTHVRGYPGRTSLTALLNNHTNRICTDFKVTQTNSLWSNLKKYCLIFKQLFYYLKNNSKFYCTSTVNVYSGALRSWMQQRISALLSAPVHREALDTCA